MEVKKDSELNVEVVDELEESQPPQQEEHYGPPIGAATFVFMMLAFYVIYWVISWFEIFVVRGVF